MKNIHHFMKSMILLNVLTIAAATILTPVWVIYVKSIGGDIRTVGNAMFIFSIIIGVFTIIAAKIEGHIKQEENIMLITAVLLVIVYAGYFFVEHPWQLYLVELLLGCVFAFHAPAMYSLYHRYMPNEAATFHWGVWTGFYNIAVGIGALTSTVCFYYFGMRAVLWLLLGTISLYSVFTFIVIAFIKKHQALCEQKAR